MRAAGIAIGSPVPRTIEPMASNYAARVWNWVDPSTLPIEEVD
jgi:hypothetical protein